jgi:hypothetical protein
VKASGQDVVSNGALLAAAPPRNEVSVVTGMRFHAPPRLAWERILYYEEIPDPPPLALRFLLPNPTRADGRKSAVGDLTRCEYREGHLLKRVTRIVPPSHCRFEVIEQGLAIAGGIRLAGGSYTLRELPGDSTRVELETRYVSERRPHWFWRPLEAAVCHAFHRHILRAMSRADRPSTVRPAVSP